MAVIDQSFTTTTDAVATLSYLGAGIPRTMGAVIHPINV